MFMLTQLTLTGAISNASCLSSNFHIYVYYKVKEKILGTVHRERDDSELSPVMNSF